MSAINRRQFVLGSGTAAAVQQALLAQAGRRYRNVLVLIADDHSPLAGCYGNSVIRTPNTDRLAQQGTLFRNAYCTTPSCSASRSVVLTGLHNHSNGQFGHAHEPANFHTHSGVQSIPRLLQAQGFATGVIGKLHVNPPQVYPWDYQTDGGPDGGTRDVWGMAQQAKEFFAKFPDRPFYLHVGFGDPHRASGPGLFANHRSYPNVRKRAYAPADVIVPHFLPDTPEVRRELAEHYEAIDRLDQGIGFLLQALEESGRAEDTMVIYMSDHGMPFPGAKGSHYDTGLHVPLVIRTPSQTKRGGACNALVNWTDILPTVMAWAGAELPQNPVYGRSLLPILEQENPEGWDAIFFSHTFHEVVNYYPFRGIRTRQYKYTKILFSELMMPLPSDLWQSPTWEGVRSRQLEKMGLRVTENVLHHQGEELYDIVEDPTETRNLAGLPQHAATLEDLRGKVREFRRQTNDTWLDYFDRIEAPPKPLQA
jgi:N-sulfoglucosamine sulfohydrolase